MAPEEIDSLIQELKDWAAQAEFGEQKKVAESLGVPPQSLNHWITGRRVPNLRDGLKLQAFLKKWRKRGKK
jgi:hypothetical protein